MRAISLCNQIDFLQIEFCSTIILTQFVYNICAADWSVQILTVFIGSVLLLRF